MCFNGHMKKELRRQILAQRTALADEAWQRINARVCEQLIQWLPNLDVTQVFGFTCHRKEPDLMPVWNALSPEVTVALPRVSGPGVMKFHAYRAGEVLKKSAYGIAEPEAHAPILTAHEKTLILVPCVAMSTSGGRLGYGGGFYDRFLQNSPQVRTYGVIFDMFVMPQLPRDDWDEVLTGWVSEKGVFSAKF